MTLTQSELDVAPCGSALDPVVTEVPVPPPEADVVPLSAPPGPIWMEVAVPPAEAVPLRTTRHPLPLSLALELLACERPPEALLLEALLLAPLLLAEDELVCAAVKPGDMQISATPTVSRLRFIRVLPPVPCSQ